MRLSCLPVSLYADIAAGRVGLADWFRLAASLGLDGADVSAAHVTDRSAPALDDLGAAAADEGVVIGMLVTYTDFTQPSARGRSLQADDLRRWIDAAARLGTPYVRVTAGQAHPDVSESEGIEAAVAGLTGCLDHAAGAGVQLLYENHVRGSIWPLQDFTQPAARFLEVARRTAHTRLGILFDTANQLALDDADPLAVFEAVQPRIRAVHLSDIRRRGAFEPAPIGRGVAPILPVLGRLVAAGFDGWISLEEASGTGRDAFGDAVAFADRAWTAAGGAPRAASR